MNFKDIEDLTNLINSELGEFCDEFQEYRKIVFNFGRIGKRGILFKFSDISRDWVINSGGGTELQYHLFLRDNIIGYGLGFNTQYVPHKNKKTTIEYMQPFANSFLSQSNIQSDLTKSGFNYIYGNKSELIDLEHDKYILLGKEFSVSLNNGFYELDNKHLNTLVNDIKGILFNSYKSIVLNLNQNKALNLFKPKQVIIPKSKGTVNTEIKKIEIDLSKLKINVNKIDYLEKHRKSMEIGDLAEQIVLDDEIDFLKQTRPNLAKQVCSVANDPKLGFDILSFETNGKQKQIEVKAISKKGNKYSFIISDNELVKSKIYSNYYIYGVTDIHSEKPKILRIKNPDLQDEKEYKIKALTYNVTFE